MQKQARRTLAFVLCTAVAVLAQETTEPTVEGRLLAILRARGVIDAAEFSELSNLERELRGSADLERQVNALVEGIQDAAPKTSFKPGKGFDFATADGKFTMTVGGRIQTRATLNDIEDADNKFNFAVQHARIWMEGSVFDPSWKYRVHFDASGDRVTAGSSTSSASATALREAYIEKAFEKALNLRFGQYKTPYSRQFITSSANLEFVDRWIGHGSFFQNYQPGMMLHGLFGGEKSDLFEYYAGVFNGNGVNVQQTAGGDNRVMEVVRVAMNPMGAVKYSESDYAGGDFKAALGLNGWSSSDPALDKSDRSIGADLTIVGHGLYLTGEWHDRSFANGDPDYEGWFAQAGYFLVPGTLDVGLRYSTWGRDGATSGLDKVTEVLGVVGYSFDQHNLKLQLDAGTVETANVGGAGDTDEFRVRLQASLIF
jgi:hypothetical protein